MPDLGSQTIDVAIGLVFVYVLLSAIVSTVNEGIAAFVGLRARFLERGLRTLLAEPGGGGVLAKLKDHPLVESLFEDKKRSRLRPRPNFPSYIPSRTFALALVDTLAPEAVEESAEDPSHDLLASLREHVQTVENEHVRGAMLPLIAEARGDIDRFRQSVERWFDESMSRVSGWYQRRVQLVLVVVALVVAVALNADSYQFASTLWKDDVVRTAVVDRATQAVEPQAPAGEGAGARALPSAPPDEGELEETAGSLEEIGELGLPIGWTGKDDTPAGALGKILGLLVTAAALALGAPFWFDLLGKIVRLRAAGPATVKSDTA